VKGRKVAYPDHQPGPDEFTQMAMDVMGALSPALRDGDPEKDIGPVVAFLLSDACHYLTGQTLTIDGGTFAFA
jgi:NAD(P)-dependent dehydrogenase (short-subunit alcohol dehydrogenase family)